MKNIFLLFSLLFFLKANCQTIASKLQNKTWFATGNLLKSESAFLYSQKPSIPTSEIKFLTDSTMQMHVQTPYDDNFIMTSLCNIKEDRIVIYYTVNYPKDKKQEKISHYYKIKELPNLKDFEFIPITSTDFK